MNRHGATTLLGVFLLLAGCAAQEPGRTARRPIDRFEIDRLSEVSDTETELVTTKFLLLERVEVCSDLKLSQEQSNAVRKAYATPWEKIPGMTEFRAQQKAAKQKSGLTAGEREALILASSRGIGKIAAEFHAQQVQAILSTQQIDRLEQLMLQARGPLMLVIDTNLATTLKLPPEALQRMRDAAKQADDKIIPGLQRFGRDFWAGYSPNETEATRTREMNALLPQLQQMIGERDQNLLRILTSEQKDQFKARQGIPLPIQWDPWDFMRQPFEKKNS
jgi:hypothetical protein